MRKLLCLLALALLIPLLFQAWRVLPLDTQPLVADKYAGWSGVLRLWIFEGWECGTGSLSPWLNRCIAGFERRHPGVYVQPQYVDAGAIASINDSGILPPDMAIFPPGLLASPAGFAPLALPGVLRGTLARCGDWNGATYAVPIAMGGYLWAWNAASIDRVPNTWRDAEASLAVPAPEAWRRWDGALLALCSAHYAEASPERDAEERVALPGIDLGLVAPSEPSPSPTPAANDSATLSCRLPEDFHFEDDAWRRFVNGDAAAIPVSQREVRKLQALSEQGRGPDWRLSPGGAAFTDQLLSLAVVDKADGDEPRALCAEFLSWLLSEDCQGELHSVGAFAVTDAPSGYAPGDPLAALEDALRQDGLLAPGCFGDGWRSDLDSIIRDFVSDAVEAPSLWDKFRSSLDKDPNIAWGQLANRPGFMLQI